MFKGYEWYEDNQKNLGESFLETLQQAKESIVSNPTAYRIRYKNRVRASVVDPFPYLILYIVNGNNIDVISVFNTRQHPKRWQKRVK